MARLDPSKYDFKNLDFELRLLSKHYTPMATFEKKYFVVHHMTIVGTGDGDACEACYQTWQTRQASAHYSVDGEYVMQHVRDKDYAWATGSTKGNLYGISVEHANKTAGPSWLVSEQTMHTGARLIANGHVLYKFGRPVDGKTLFQHDNFFATACPGPFLGGTQWKAYVALVQRYYDEITGATSPVEPPKPVVRTAVWGKPETWVLGAIGPDVTKLGERIVVWSKALGLPSPYKEGPGEPYSPTDVAGLQNLQKAWGFGSDPEDLKLGGSSDGYPGLKSFEKLMTNPTATPTPKPEDPVTTVDILFWNIAGSDTTNGYQLANGYRGEPLGEYANKIGFDVFLACEASQKNLRAGVSKGLGLTSWMERAKAIWFKPDKVKQIASREAISDTLFAYLKTLKWGGAFYGSKNGKKFSVIVIHTDYRAPAKQAKQVQSIFKKFRAKSDKLGIPHTNQFVCGDFNWDGTKGDNPFTSLADWNFEEKGSRTVTTFMERKHLDGFLIHESVKAEIDVKSRSNGKMKLSDHNPVKARITLS